MARSLFLSYDFGREPGCLFIRFLMDHRRIIGEAWEFTQENKPIIRWYAFLPAVISTCAGIIYLIYQFYAFKSSRLFENWSTSLNYVMFQTVYDLIRNNIPALGPLIISVIIVVVLYFFVPPLLEGSIIQLIARKKNKLTVKTIDGVKYGFLSFLPMFEYATFVKTFQLTSLLGWMAMILRSMGWGGFETFLPIFIIGAVAAVFLTILFTYTEFFIVIDDYKVIESISRSCILVIKNWQETLLLSILMLIITLRIVIQILFVLLIPVILFGSIYLFTLASLQTVGIVVGVGIGLILLYIAAYLSSTIHVFASAVWTFTFLELTKDPELNARGEVVEEKDDEKD